LGRPIIGIIPEDDHARVALSLKQPLVQSHPESPASIAFKQLAASLTGQPYQPSLPDRQEHSEKPSEHASFFSSILTRLQGEERGDDHAVVSQATQG
ncbi:hypothetical protein HYU19_04690, partial [Candidatus Woesearchaeota archaeon]|nr:hypothetical protein [Candidatus Woesearchaeota archaeon]